MTTLREKLPSDQDILKAISESQNLQRKIAWDIFKVTKSVILLLRGWLYAIRLKSYNPFFRMVILIPFLTQPPHERTLTGRGSRVYPNVGAAGCTLKVGAARCTLTSGQPGAAWSGQEVCSGFALAARASPSRLGLRPSRLALRARGSLYEFVLYNSYKILSLYEFVLYNSYKNCRCMNS
jgi:hypothetical protein